MRSSLVALGVPILSNKARSSAVIGGYPWSFVIVPSCSLAKRAGWRADRPYHSRCPPTEAGALVLLTSLKLAQIFRRERLHDRLAQHRPHRRVAERVGRDLARPLLGLLAAHRFVSSGSSESPSESVDVNSSH